MIKVLKRLFLVTLSLTTISIIIYFTLIPTELDNFAFQPEFIIENELIYGENNDEKYYNRSFEGFNEFYIKNLKKTIDFEKKMGDQYFEERKIANNTPIVIWWTPFTMDMGSYKECRNIKKTCFFTNIRRYRSQSNLKAFLFYGTDFSLHDLPLPRLDLEDWGLLHEESPKNNYLFSFEKIMNLFNHTATFKRESDLPLLTQYLTSIEDLESTEFLVPVKDKNLFQVEENLAPIAYIQSDCNTPSDRDIYVKALMKYIKVDSYGKCLHNKDLPKNLNQAVVSMNSKEFYKIIAKYKFVLAMENAVCDDYVTEKLWRSFYIGAVPIVYGSSKSKEIYPDTGTAIDILDFNSPKELAEYLTELNQNDTKYKNYLRFKRKNGVKNPLLLELMSKRKWGINNDREKGSYIDHFECLVCERLHQNLGRIKNGETKVTWQANKQHFGCPSPYTFSEEGILLNQPDNSNYVPNNFLTSYQFGYVQQKVFFDKYYNTNLTNLTYKTLHLETLKFHRELFISGKNKIDLK